MPAAAAPPARLAGAYGAPDTRVSAPLEPRIRVDGPQTAVEATTPPPGASGPGVPGNRLYGEMLKPLIARVDPGRVRQVVESAEAAMVRVQERVAARAAAEAGRLVRAGLQHGGPVRPSPVPGGPGSTRSEYMTMSVIMYS